MKKKELYKKVIERFGVEKQIIMLAEEQGELIHSISSKNRGLVLATKGHIAEEIADCQIMMEQMQEIFKVSDKLVSDWKREKLLRLKKAIEKE